MKLNVRKDFFCFVRSREDYSARQKKEIVTLFKHPPVKRVFMLSLYLLIWSLAGMVMDTLFLGGCVLTIWVTRRFMWVYFLPAFIYFTVNTATRFIFIKACIKRDIGIKVALLATLPYAGSLILCGALLKKHPLFLEALLGYIKHLRRRGCVALWKMKFSK